MIPFDRFDKPERLSPEQVALVAADFASLCAKYESELRPDGRLLSHLATEYARRIGAANLLSYAETLKAGERRRKQAEAGLLAALEMALHTLETPGDFSDDNEMRYVIADIDAVIRKARGEV